MSLIRLYRSIRSIEIHTFEWYNASINKLFIVEAAPEATGVHRAEGQIRDAQLGRDLDCETEERIGNYAGHLRPR